MPASRCDGKSSAYVSISVSVLISIGKAAINSVGIASKADKDMICECSSDAWVVLQLRSASTSIMLTCLSDINDVSTSKVSLRGSRNAFELPSVPSVDESAPEGAPHRDGENAFDLGGLALP